jgi:hypothetical protein
MKRKLIPWAAAAVLAAATWTPAAAQTPGGDWDVFVMPYLLGPSIGGTTMARTRSATVDLSPSDIISNLKFGAMGLVVARKGEWGIAGDGLWMSLGKTVRNADVGFKQGAFAVYGLRQLGPAADLMFGARVNTLRADLAFYTPEVDVNGDKTWVDPLVGLALRAPAYGRLESRIYGEVGGFGAGSKFTWQVYPAVGVLIGKGVSLDVGYRWLDIDYATGEGDAQFAYDVLTRGPVMGVKFRF